MNAEDWGKIIKIVLSFGALAVFCWRMMKVYKTRQGIMLINKAYKLSQKGDIIRAIDLYKRAMDKETPGVKKEELCLTIAVTCENADMNEDALYFVNKALELDSKNALAYRHMGIAYSNLGKRPDSLRAYKKSLELDPVEPNTWISYATELLMSNEVQQAIRAIEKAISLDSKNGKHYTGLAYAYAKIFDIANAEKYLKLAKKHGDKDTQYAKDAIQQAKETIDEFNADLNEFGVDMQELLSRIDRFETETRLNYLQIKASNEKCGEKDSKFAGIPYQGAGFTWPSDTHGNPMNFLAQLNFKQVPHLDGFPTEGILQFFVSQRLSPEPGVYDQPEYTESKVIFYPQTFDDWNLSTVKAAPLAGGDFPIRGELKLSFESASEPMTAYDFRFAEKFQRLVGIQFDELPDEITDMVVSRFGTGHKAGGYPSLCQSDPRETDSDYSNHTVQLLQIDSDAGAGIMWGDNGTCSFLISSGDLEKLDFNNVLFIWDCY